MFFLITELNFFLLQCIGSFVVQCCILHVKYQSACQMFCRKYNFFPLILRELLYTHFVVLICSVRFMSASVEQNIQTYILELVHDQLTRRQTLDSITRNLLKLLTVTCGYSQIRLLVSQRLEMWLQNPKVKLMCLLQSFALNCCTV